MKNILFVITTFALLHVSCNMNPINPLTDESTADLIRHVDYDSNNNNAPIIKNGFIQISTFEQLTKIGNDPAYPLSAWDGDCRMCNGFFGYELTGDIDASASRNMNNGQGFKPIGGWGNPFEAIFDGKGFKIKNLYINRSIRHSEIPLPLDHPLVHDYNTGLFGAAGRAAIIQNVILDAVTIKGINSVGGIAGAFRSGRIINCHVMGTIEGDSAVGGLVGFADGGGDFTKIKRSSANVNIRSNGSGVGGLVGVNISEIYDSYATGNISGHSAVGGLVGRHMGGITNCFSTVTLEGVSNVGGLVGEQNNVCPRVIKSFWDVEVSGVDIAVGYDRYLGIEQYYTGFTPQTGPIIHNRYAEGTGKTTAEMKQRATYKDWDFAGIWQIDEGVGYPRFR